MKFSSVFFFAFVVLFFGQANALETKVKQAIVMDFDTGKILFEKKANAPMPPASMSKIMTAYLIFEKLKAGALSMDDTFQVSENAWKKGGSKTGSSTMFLKPDQSVKLGDLIRGIIIQSGNDACIVAAENISGSEENFVALANKKAQDLGLTETNLVNSTGWPHPKHVMSPKDLAILARHLITDFPEYYSIYSEREFTYNKVKQENRNNLLYSMRGVADGIKTGHTAASGYGLVGSAKRGSRRLIVVVNGLKTMKERGDEAASLLNYGFREFNNYTLLKKGVKVVQVPVWLGKQRRVSAVPEEQLVLTLPLGKQKEIQATVKYMSYIKAPIKKGDKIATITFDLPNKETKTIDLVASENVVRLGYYGRLKETIKYLLFKGF